MRYEIPPTSITTEQITQSVLACLGRLLQERQLNGVVENDFAAVRNLLEAIPLSTDQYGLACQRLKNAEHYLRYTEPGAAWYELRLLASSLKNGQLQVREPRRRLRRKAKRLT